MAARKVTIAGEERTLAEFSTYKAEVAFDELTKVEALWQEIVTAMAEFKRRWEAEHYVELERSEARREFRPKVLYRSRLSDDGTVIEEPMLGPDGEPLLGPDPLGHLSEEDWAASGHHLRVSDSPSRDMQWASIVPLAFQKGRKQVVRVIALTLISNTELEEWDEADRDLDAELDAAARKLSHRSQPEELLLAATAIVGLLQEQLGGPFEEFAAQVGGVLKARQKRAEVEQEPEPMRPEPSEEPTSSTPSPDATAGTPEPASTALAGASASGSSSG
jgi:hypothetical protein